jgi:ferredoxin
MDAIEARIKDFVNAQGVEVVGIAGPERLDGPPSVDLDYSMPGARSVISMALPMNVDAIYDFLSKKSPAPHNLDQFLNYQRLQRIGKNLADYLVSQGYRAMAVPLSADYRRALYVFKPRPAFSLRLGAIASGIGGQGWSGNVKTREYGSAIYLGAVLTDAGLESDPALPPDYFISQFCIKCKRCTKACPTRMFVAREDEHILLNGELYERGSRRNIDLCHISCFGLHALSLDKDFTNWGEHWIDGWLKREPNPDRKLKMILDMLKRGLTTGNSWPRFDALRVLCSQLWPEELMEGIPEVEDLPQDESQRYEILATFIRRMGIEGMDGYPIPMICGQCSLVCGPTVEETAYRYRLLADSGYVVPGADGKMTRVDTLEEAQELRRRYPDKAGFKRMAKDIMDNIIMWHKHYGGLEPRTFYQSRLYDFKLKKALRKAGKRG